MLTVFIIIGYLFLGMLGSYLLLRYLYNEFDCITRGDLVFSLSLIPLGFVTFLAMLLYLGVDYLSSNSYMSKCIWEKERKDV